MAEAQIRVQLEIDNINRSNEPVNKKESFSPVKLPTAPSVTKNLTGMKRLTKDLAADIFNHIQKWNDLHLQGCNLVKLISEIKTVDPACKSEELEQACCELSDVVTGLERTRIAISGFGIQIRTLVQLARRTHPKNEDILFVSHDMASMARLIDPIVSAYNQECNERRFIADNIPFTKTGKEATFLCVLWTYQAFITNEVQLHLEALLAEVGYRKAT